MMYAFSVAPRTSDQTLRTLLRAYEPQCGGEEYAQSNGVEI
jgi:hypothetical protein